MPFRRRRGWLLAFGAAALVAVFLLWPIGAGAAKTTNAAVLTARLSELHLTPGWKNRFPDETLFGSWFAFSPAPCQDGPGAFSMWIKPDWTVQITTAAEGTRLYQIAELRRTAMTPRNWEAGAIVLRGRTEDGSGVRMLLRQTNDNVMEPVVYELQAPEGDIANVLAAPPPLVRCGHSP